VMQLCWHLSWQETAWTAVTTCNISATPQVAVHNRSSRAVLAAQQIESWARAV
jgi:hypothetical protein